MPRLVKYIGGVSRTLKGTVIEGNGPSEHIHLAVRLPATLAVAEYVNKIKTNSSKWIHETAGTFARQDGYSAFSVSQSGIAKLVTYVRNQQAHHRRRSYQEELIMFLQKHEVEYDERYIWK